MAELSVVIVATDNEQRAVLQVLVDGTSGGAHRSYLRQFSRRCLRRCHATCPPANPDVTPGRSFQPIIPPWPARYRTLASGDARSGDFRHRQSEPAASHCQRPCAPELANSLSAPLPPRTCSRPSCVSPTAQRRTRQEGNSREMFFLVINAKGGQWRATTVAVTLALALHSSAGQTASSISLRWATRRCI